MSPFTFWPLPLSLLRNQRDRTRMPSWNALLIQPADYQHPSHTPNLRVEFLTVSRSRSKTSTLSGRKRNLLALRSKRPDVAWILGSVQCVISGQIIEIAIENPHHKGQKTSCWISAYRRLQSDWNTPFGSLPFLRALGNVLRMVESFLSFFVKEKL